MRRIVIVVPALLGMLVLGVGAAVIALPHIDLHRLAAARASAALGREVTIGTLHVALGDPIAVALQDATLADAITGAGPAMARLQHLAADLDPWQFLHGRLAFRRIVIDGLAIDLARGNDGRGNWQLPGLAPPSGAAGLRASIPGIRDAALTNALLTLRTSGGQLLRIAAASLSLHAPDDESPIRVDAEGSYNDTPVRFAATLESFDRLRDNAVPFGAVVTASAAAATVTFAGSAADPLHADAVSGVVRADLARLDTPLAVAGLKLRMDVPMTLASPLQRRGGQWALPSITGTFAGAAYVGHAELAEGDRGQPDKLALALDLAQVKADTLLSAIAAADGKALDAGATPLWIDPAPGLLVDAQLATRQLLWGATGAADAHLHLLIAPGRIAVPDAALTLAGGRMAGTVEAVPAGNDAALTAHADVAGLDLGSLLRIVGAGSAGASGRLDGRADATLRGATLGAAAAAARGQGVVTIAEGQVARQLMHLASADLGLLFEPTAGVTPILCFLAVAEVRDGVATIAPLRLRTRDGTLVGGGSIDLRRGTLEIAAKTLAVTTGFLSLDLPIQVSGPLRKPAVQPGSDAAATARIAQGAATLRRLPADLAPVAQRNGCAR